MSSTRRIAVRSATSALAIASFAVLAPRGIHAQQPPPTDSVRVELARLAALVDSLRAEVERLRSAGQDEEADDALADLRAAAQAAAAAGSGNQPTGREQGAQEFVGRQRSLQALNPEISVNADMLGHVDKDATGSDNFVFREVEISLISNLDPYSRAQIFISRHAEGAEIAPFGDAHGHGSEEGEEGEDAHGAGFAMEEGYVEWVGLPGGLGLKFGRFFQQFGQLNRWHSHALPFQSRSLPHIAFIGEEPLGQTGASAHWLAPFGGSAGTYEATLEVTRSSNESLFGESAGVSVLGNVNAFWQLSRATDLDLSLSWMNGSYEDEEHLLDRTLYGAEAAFTWRPPERARYRGIQLRGGVMALDGLVAEEHEEEQEEHEEEEEPHAEGELPERAMGYWSMAEVRLGQSWLIGGRFDWTENPQDPDETAWLFAPTLTWWQSEFVRVRAEYDLLGRSFENAREGRFVLQVTFAMGPHKHATY
ncbi:MAG: hypothetical protein RJQ04_05470 [Longimicrobiales bacterium]